MIESNSPIVPYDENDRSDPHLRRELSQTGRATLDGIVWRKLDRRILPLCTCLFLFSTLDRANIANARIVGLQKSLVISNYQYTLALTLTYVSYAAVEFPSTLLLKYVGPNIMLPATATLWGLVSACQGFVGNFSGLMICRLFLGLCEGSILPGIILYLSSFYPRKRLQIRVATFSALGTLAGTFSGLLAAAIDELNGKGGKPGWSWIFILEGTASIVFGVICFFLLPCTPEKARFLVEEERKYVVFALKRDGSVSKDDSQDRFSWTEVTKSTKSPHLWFLAIAVFFNGAIMIGLAFFEPTIVALLGYKGNQAQLMSVPPFVVASALAFPSAVISDRYQCRGYTVIFFSFLQVIGFTMFYVSTSSHVRYGSLFFSLPGAFCAAPALSTWVANNSAPHVRRATAVGVAFTMTQLGGILSTWLLGWLSPAPDFTTAVATFIGMSIGMILFSTANLLYLRRANQSKAERRVRMGEQDEREDLGDSSAWFVYSL